MKPLRKSLIRLFKRVNMTNPAIVQYWNEFVQTLSPGSPYRSRTFVAEGFGDSPELADELGRLVLSGVKTGTCSALWEWEAEGSLLPQPGQMTVVLDGHKHPICITETTQVWVCRFNNVDDEFAASEGEGDGSLKHWRESHARYFLRMLPRIDKEFSEEMPVVCERFQVVYK
jgi:uncharacterized protein YhfF